MKINRLDQKCNSSILRAEYIRARAGVRVSPPLHIYYIIIYYLIIAIKASPLNGLSRPGGLGKFMSNPQRSPPSGGQRCPFIDRIKSWSGLSSLTGQRRRPRRSMILEDHMPAARAATAIPSQTDHPQAAHARGNKQPVILALDFGQRTGWASRNHDGAIVSGVQEFRHGRFKGGVPMAQVIGGAR